MRRSPCSTTTPTHSTSSSTPAWPKCRPGGATARRCPGLLGLALQALGCSTHSSGATQDPTGGCGAAASPCHSRRFRGASHAGTRPNPCSTRRPPRPARCLRCSSSSRWHRRRRRGSWHRRRSSSSSSWHRRRRWRRRRAACRHTCRPRPTRAARSTPTRRSRARRRRRRRTPRTHRRRHPPREPGGGRALR